MTQQLSSNCDHADDATKANKFVGTFEDEHCIGPWDPEVDPADVMATLRSGIPALMLTCSWRNGESPPCTVVPSGNLATEDDRVSVKLGWLCLHAVRRLDELPMGERTVNLDTTCKQTVHRFSDNVPDGGSRKSVHVLVRLKLVLVSSTDKHGVRVSVKLDNDQTNVGLLVWLEETNAMCIVLVGRGLCQLIDETTIDDSRVNVLAMKNSCANHHGLWHPGCPRRCCKATGELVAEHADVDAKDLTSRAGDCARFGIMFLNLCIVHCQRELDEGKAAAVLPLPPPHKQEIATLRKFGMRLQPEQFDVFKICVETTPSHPCAARQGRHVDSGGAQSFCFNRTPDEQLDRGWKQHRQPRGQRNDECQEGNTFDCGTHVVDPADGAAPLHRSQQHAACPTVGA